MPARSLPAPLPGIPPGDPSGRCDPTHQLRLDNQIRQGRAGCRVLTPFHLIYLKRTVTGSVPSRGYRGIRETLRPPRLAGNVPVGASSLATQPNPAFNVVPPTARDVPAMRDKSGLQQSSFNFDPPGEEPGDTRDRGSPARRSRRADARQGDPPFRPPRRSGSLRISARTAGRLRGFRQVAEPLSRSALRGLNVGTTISWALIRLTKESTGQSAPYDVIE
jgi:hypothetical protein